MKKLLLIIFIFLSVSMYAQEKWWKLSKTDLWSGASMFAAGYCNGTVELLQYDYEAFENFYGDVNDQRWNPDISWENKHKNGDPSQGSAFFMSKTLAVPVTDAYHAFRAGEATFYATSITLYICADKVQGWKNVLFKLAFNLVMNKAGFHLGYSLPRYLNDQN